MKALQTSPLSESHPNITQSFSYYVDEKKIQNPQIIAERLKEFTASTPDDIPFGLGTQSYWILINLNNKTNKPTDIVLHLDNAMLVSPAVYEFESIKRQNAQAIKVKSMAGVIFPRVDIKILAKERRSLLLNLKSYGPPNIPLIFYETSSFDNKTNYSYIFYGAFIAIILVMAVYNLVLFAAIKDVVYLLYVGYLLSSFVVLGSVIGFSHIVFPYDLQLFINTHSLFFHYYLVLFLLLFSLYFLRYDVKKGGIYWLGIFFSVILVVLSVASLWLSHDNQAKLFFSLQPLFYLVTLVLVIKRLNRSYAWARFYFISWIPLLIGAAVQPLMLLNQLNYSFLNRNAFMIAVLLEVIFMAFALAERMRRFEIERIRDVSYHPKTNLPRKVLIENAIDTLSRLPESNFSVLVIEPEQIDRISLYLTDEQKNQLLKRLNSRLSRLFSFNDAVIALSDKEEKICVLSGNRFAILVDHKYSTQALNVLIKSIQQMVEKDYQLEELKLPLSAVIGVSNFPEHGDNGPVLLNRAQLAIAYAKVDHQQWSYFEESRSDKTSYYLAIACDMKEAIEQGGFELYHQPQIDLKTLNVCGSEVLLRWNHKQQGFIPPDVFIPIAEDMGLINKLTQWVMHQAVNQQLILLENGYNHMISINISGKDLAALEFYDFVVELLNETAVPASKIALELTESSTIANNKRAVSVVEKLAGLGLIISIDDFGTGYSSMAYINELPFQELKVDRQFVENVCDDKRRKVIAETTVRMAKGLGLEVVAEGINSKQDEETLKGFGCDIGQGYYYAKPMPLNDYLLWLEKEVNGQVTQSVINDLDGEFIPKNT